MARIEGGREHRWANVSEWFEWALNEGHVGKLELLDWLIEQGHVGDDEIQECFQDVMSKDGFFFGNPIDPEWPLTKRESTGDDADCRDCGNTFIDSEITAMEEGTFSADDVECEQEEVDCPVRTWCRKGKKVEE